jgi:hypothetical protein
MDEEGTPDPPMDDNFGHLSSCKNLSVFPEEIESS